MLKCPSCATASMAPLETIEGDWEEDHSWVQDADGSTYKLSVFFVCPNKHVTVLAFCYDGEQISHTARVYSHTELEEGITGLLD